MTYIKEMSISLKEWETKILLEQLEKECARLKNICETSQSDDEIADAGNEFMEIDGLRERLVELAIATFGPGVMNFSREPL